MKYLQTYNESVRSLMKPKNEEEIYQVLSKKYNIDIDIFKFLEENGFCYVNVHNTEYKDLWKGITFEFYNDKTDLRLLFRSSDTIETIKEKIYMDKDRTNESVRDMMKPMSEEQTKEVIKNMKLDRYTELVNHEVRKLMKHNKKNPVSSTIIKKL